MTLVLGGSSLLRTNEEEAQKKKNASAATESSTTVVDSNATTSVKDSQSSTSVFANSLQNGTSGDNLELSSSRTLSSGQESEMSEETAALVSSIRSRLPEDEVAAQNKRFDSLENGKSISKRTRKKYYNEDVKMAAERVRIMDELAKNDPDFYNKMVSEFKNLPIGEQQALIYKFFSLGQVPTAEQAASLATNLTSASPAVRGFACGQMKHLKKNNKKLYKQVAPVLREGLKSIGYEWTTKGPRKITTNEVGYVAVGVEESEDKDLQQTLITTVTSAKPEDIEGQKDICEFIIGSRMTEDEENRRVLTESLPNLRPELQSDIHKMAYESKNFDSTEDRNRLISVIDKFTSENQLKATNNIINSSKTDENNLRHLKEEVKNFDTSTQEKVLESIEQKIKCTNNNNNNNKELLQEIRDEIASAVKKGSISATAGQEVLVKYSLNSVSERPSNIQEFITAIKQGAFSLSDAIRVAKSELLSAIGSFDMDTQNKIIAESSTLRVAEMCAANKFGGRIQDIALQKVKASPHIDVRLAKMLSSVLSYGELKDFAYSNNKISGTVKSVFGDAMNKRYSTHVRFDKESGSLA